MSVQVSQPASNLAKRGIPAQRLPCPTCGYDLSGTVNTWKDACPLEGTCSECGSALEWSRVYAASNVPTWSCEHAERFSIWKLFRTAIILLRPRAYWRALTPEMPVRPARLAAMVVTFALLAYAAMVVYWMALILGFYSFGVRGAPPFKWADVLARWSESAIGAPTLMGMGGRSGDLSEGWDILLALAALLVAWFAVDTMAARFAPTKPTRGHEWRAASMLMLGLAALHTARYFIVMTSDVVGEVISPGFGMGYGMLIGPILCSTKATACLILLYGVTMWTACLLNFHRLKRWRLAVIIAWLVIDLTVFWYWLYPFIVWYAVR